MAKKDAATEVVETEDESTVGNFPSQESKIGRVFFVQEALGYMIGTVVEETPFALYLGADSCWVRDLGPMADFMANGTVNEFHPMPNMIIKDHAIRFMFPCPHPSPASQGAAGRRTRR